MTGKAGKLGIRILLEAVLWLPALLLLTARMSLPDKLGTAAIALFCIVAGLIVARLPSLWHKLALLTISLALVAVGIVWFTDQLPLLILLCAALWRGRFRRFDYWQYAFAFGICCLTLLAIAINEAWVGYRTVTVVLSVLWMIGWFVSFNRSLIEKAGLDNGIVTRTVLLSSRKYAIVFTALGVLAIAVTVGYGEKWLTPKKVNMSPILEDIGVELEPPAQMQPQFPLEGMKEAGKPSPIWDYLFWVFSGFALIGLAWFVRLLWRDRTWTWRGLLQKIRDWFTKEQRVLEPLPYVEERRSLRNEKKARQGGLASLLRGKRSRTDWDKLSNSEKVRRLYEDAVEAGIRQGYAFRAADTPGETLESLESWQTQRSTASDKSRRPTKDRQVDDGSWLRRVRRGLADLYGKARYSSHDISSEEIEELRT